MKDDVLVLHGDTEDTRGGELAQTTAAVEASTTIQAAVVLAHRFKRNEEACWEALMRSCKRPSFAEGTVYDFPRGNTRVIGPSVKMAREAARIWGNIRTGIDILYDEPGDGTTENPGLRRIRGWAWDLQTNRHAAYEDSFLKLIQRKAGWIVPDERDLRELTNRRGAMCERNAMLAIIPTDLIDDGMATAAATVESRANDDPEHEKKKLIMAFSRLNITPEMLEEYLGHQITQVAPQELATLREIWTSINDGNSTWAEYLGAVETPEVVVIDRPATNATPWEAITKKQVSELRKLGHKQELSDSDILLLLNKEDLGSLEALPADEFTAAIDMLQAEGKK